MKAVKKFATFEDLKSYESKTMNYEVSLKKHSNFEKVIKNIRSDKVGKSNQRKSK
jgi:hypothetical protein